MIWFRLVWGVKRRESRECLLFQFVGDSQIVQSLTRDDRSSSYAKNVADQQSHSSVCQKVDKSFTVTKMTTIIVIELNHCNLRFLWLQSLSKICQQNTKSPLKCDKPRKFRVECVISQTRERQIDSLCHQLSSSAVYRELVRVTLQIDFFASSHEIFFRGSSDLTFVTIGRICGVCSNRN